MKTVLFYLPYVKLCSVIYLALKGHSFSSKWEIFCIKPLSKTCKNQWRHQAIFPFVLLPSNNDPWMCPCTLSSWESGIPLNELFILGGRLFNLAKGKHALKHTQRAVAFQALGLCLELSQKMPFSNIVKGVVSKNFQGQAPDYLLLAKALPPKL